MRIPHSCYDGRVRSGVGGIGLMGGRGVALVAEGSGAGRLLGWERGWCGLGCGLDGIAACCCWSEV
eukprot:3275788-Alexandrium_andersonii.AAC.1